MEKKRSTKVVVALVAGCVAIATLVIWRATREVEPQDNLSAAPAVSRLPAAVQSSAPNLVSKPVTTAPSAAAEAASSYYHRKMAGRPVIDRIYQSVLNRLPPGKDSELVAVYVAESIARNGSTEFAHFMTDLHQALADRSLALYQLILSQESALQQDAFTYQMTLNLAAHLQLPGDLKAQLLGDAMSIHFATDPTMGVTAMSANITNAFILMKNNGISAQQAAPYIQQGIAVNRDDPNSLAEFIARANTYYPGSVATH